MKVDWDNITLRLDESKQYCEVDLRAGKVVDLQLIPSRDVLLRGEDSSSVLKSRDDHICSYGQ